MSDGRPSARLYAAAAVVAVVVVGIAFVAAPRSCEGGLELYLGTGIAALAVLAALPFFSSPAPSFAARFAWSAGFVAFGAVAWVAGLFAANVRILCRLF